MFVPSLLEIITSKPIFQFKIFETKHIWSLAIDRLLVGKGLEKKHNRCGSWMKIDSLNPKNCRRGKQKFVVIRHKEHLQYRPSVAFALVLLYHALWLASKIRATFTTNEKQNQSQSLLPRACFPALDASDVNFP